MLGKDRLGWPGHAPSAPARPQEDEHVTGVRSLTVRGAPLASDIREGLNCAPLFWAPPYPFLGISPGPHWGPGKPQAMTFCSWSSDVGKQRSLGHEVMFPQNRGHCHLQSLTFPLKASNCRELWES